MFYDPLKTAGYKTKKVEYPPGSGKLIRIKYNIGHKSNSRNSIPNSIVDHMLDDGYVDVRTHYDNYGRKDWEIHTTDHGNPKEHPYGKHGEHAHDYVWGSGGRLKSMKRRELTA